MSKKKILFLTHIYPRTENDYIASFLGLLAEGLAERYEIIVLCPWHHQAVQMRNGVRLEYFRYSLRSWEKLSYTGNLFAKVRGFKPAYQMLAICFLIFFTLKALFLTWSNKPAIIHSHWFVPAGVVGHVTSLLTGTPHIVTVYSDAFLIQKHCLLKRIAKIVFKRARAVIAISEAVKEYVQPICPNVKVVYPCSRVF